MLKKNMYERRFNTAGARILISSKLPSDFFRPSREKEGKDSSLWSRTSNRYEDIQKEGMSMIGQKDPLLFTFHRSNSHDRLKLKQPLNKNPSLTKMRSELVSKLPILVRYEKGKQNNFVVPGKEKLRKLVKINSRMLYETNRLQVDGL